MKIIRPSTEKSCKEFWSLPYTHTIRLQEEEKASQTVSEILGGTPTLQYAREKQKKKRKNTKEKQTHDNEDDEDDDDRSDRFIQELPGDNDCTMSGFFYDDIQEPNPRDFGYSERESKVIGVWGTKNGTPGKHAVYRAKYDVKFKGKKVLLDGVGIMLIERVEDRYVEERQLKFYMGKVYMCHSGQTHPRIIGFISFCFFFSMDRV